MVTSTQNEISTNVADDLQREEEWGRNLDVHHENSTKTKESQYCSLALMRMIEHAEQNDEASEVEQSYSSSLPIIIHWGMVIAST